MTGIAQIGGDGVKLRVVHVAEHDGTACSEAVCHGDAHAADTDNR